MATWLALQPALVVWSNKLSLYTCYSRNYNEITTVRQQLPVNAYQTVNLVVQTCIHDSRSKNIYTETGECTGNFLG